MADSTWFPWLVSTLVLASMAGCSAGSVAETTSPSEPGDTASLPPWEPNPDPAPLPESLTFEAGSDLDPALWLAGWHVEPIDMTNGYAVVFERDDWEESQFDGNGCVSTRFHRFGSLEGLDLTLDDRSLSDQYLAQYLDIPVDDVAESGSDVLFPVVGRSTTVDFRLLAGGWDDGRTWLTAARVFGALDTVLVVGLDCEPGSMTGASTQEMWDHLPEVAGSEGLSVGLGRVGANVVEALDFDEGHDLVETSGAGWVDRELAEDASWEFVDDTPDDGSWSYESTDGDCTAEFEQSYLDEYTRSFGEDRVASDELLSIWLALPVDEVTDAATDGGLGLGVPGNDLVAARLVEEEGGSGGTVTAARALVQPGFGFVIAVECRTSDPRNALERVIAKSAIQVVP